MTAPQLFGVMVALAAMLGIAGVRGGWLKLPKRRVRHDDLDAQIAADFAPEHRAEARALVDSVLAHAREHDQTRVWRSLVDGCRGDIRKLRKVTPKAIESIHKIYRLFGDTGDQTTPAE